MSVLSPSNIPIVSYDLQWLYHLRLIWRLTVGWNIAASAFGFCLMGIDKSNARHDERRIREMTLLVTAVMGGWAGIALGMRAFRHKTNDWFFIVMEVAAFLAWKNFFDQLYALDGI